MDKDLNGYFKYSDGKEWQRRTANSEMPPLIITAALTGGFHGKEANPNLPEQPEEIIEESYACWKAGASVVHIHAREKDGKPSSDPAIYRTINKGIRKRCDLIIQNTTGGGPGMTVEERMRTIDADPEMISLNMGTMVAEWKGTEAVFSNSLGELEFAAKRILDKGIKPEMEVYNIPMLANVEHLIARNLLKKPYIINLVLGMDRTLQGALHYTPKMQLMLVEFLPEDSVFNAMAIGPYELSATTMSILLGGHVRVGMEDNVYYRKGELLKSNAQLVERVARIAKELQRPIATTEEARKMLGLSEPGHRK